MNTIDPGEALYLLHARQRLLRAASYALHEEHDQARAIDLVLEILETLHRSEERVMDLHREAISMIEHCKKVLHHTEASRPTVIHMAQAAPGAAKTNILRWNHERDGYELVHDADSARLAFERCTRPLVEERAVEREANLPMGDDPDEPKR